MGTAAQTDRFNNDPRGNLAPGVADGAPADCGGAPWAAAACGRAGGGSRNGGRGATGVENAASELAEIMPEYRLAS